MTETYWDSVRDMAQEIKDAYPDPDADHDERVEMVYDSVGGSSWIIYWDDNEKVLRNTDNEPDAIEVMTMVKPGADWRDIRQVAAFLAMESDIYEMLRELDEQDAEQDDDQNDA